MPDFYNHVIPAIERALALDLPDVEYHPYQKPGQDAPVETKTRRPHRGDIDVYAFPQSWSDTSLGFGGLAGQAFTSAYTTVIISNLRIAAVYIGGRLAYLAEVDEALMEDIRNHCMIGRTEGPNKRYKLLKLGLRD